MSLLVRHARRGQLAEFLIDQRKQLTGGLGVALLHSLEDMRDVTHDQVPNCQRPAECDGPGKWPLVAVIACGQGMIAKPPRTSAQG